MKQNEKQELALNKLRTDLSIKRTLLACKRTLLSYISMACVFVSLAITYLKVAFNNKIDWIVLVMLGMGLFFLVFGIVEYVINRKSVLSLFKRFEINVDEDDINTEE